MNWFKLKESKCPKCGKLLSFMPTSALLSCLDDGFSISAEKLKSIVNDLTTRKFDSPKQLDINDDFRERVERSKDFDEE